ncbi:MAG: c-type cytochrome, partial [Moraxellaceae bacterium]
MKMIALLTMSILFLNAHAETGENLYQSNCAQCHGKNREGALAPSLVDDVWVHGAPTRQNLIAIIANGIPGKAMPGWASTLSNENIALIADYLLTKNVAGTKNNTSPDLSALTLPKGFSISVYADNVVNARSMAVADNGIVYVGSRKAGKVYAVIDENKDKLADKVITVADGLNAPIGVTLFNGSLYVAEISRVIKFDDIAKNYDQKPKYKMGTTVTGNRKIER